MDERLLLWLIAVIAITAVVVRIEEFRYRRRAIKFFESGRCHAYLFDEVRHDFYPCDVLDVRNGGREFLCGGRNFPDPRWVPVDKVRVFH